MKDDWLIEVSDKTGDFKIYPLLLFGNRKWRKSVIKRPTIENFKAFSLYTSKSKVEEVSDIITGIFNVVVNQGGKVLGSLITTMTCYVLSGVSFLNSKIALQTSTSLLPLISFTR